MDTPARCKKPVCLKSSSPFAYKKQWHVLEQARIPTATDSNRHGLEQAAKKQSTSSKQTATKQHKTANEQQPNNNQTTNTQRTSSKQAESKQQTSSTQAANTQQTSNNEADTPPRSVLPTSPPPGHLPTKPPNHLATMLSMGAGGRGRTPPYIYISHQPSGLEVVWK